MAARKDLVPPVSVEPSSPPSPSLSQSSKSSGVFGEQDDVHDSASDTGTDAPSSVENRLSRPSTAGGSVRSDASGILGTGGSRGVSVRDAALAGTAAAAARSCVLRALCVSHLPGALAANDRGGKIKYR